jgi:hypothetical protein
MNQLVHPLHCEFDVSPCRTSSESLMRLGYSPFTLRTLVRWPPASPCLYTGCPTFNLEDTALPGEPQREIFLVDLAS